MSADFSVVPLTKQHNRASFRCDVDALDRYLHLQAGQDIRRDAASVYVLQGSDGKEIKGFYTLSAYGVKAATFPAELKKNFPNYEILPAYLLGRLAVANCYKGQGLGEKLLLDALRRCVMGRQLIAALAVIVDAIDDTAAEFYKRYDFQAFPNNPRKLFIRMKPLVRLFENK